MIIRIFLFHALLISFFSNAQIISPTLAKQLLPAFQKDDVEQFKINTQSNNVEVKELLSLASSTNCPNIFRYILEHYPDSDPELSVALALRFASNDILKVLIDKDVPLGEYPVNQVLDAAWREETDDMVFADSIMVFMLSLLFSEESLIEYYPLLIKSPSDSQRSRTADWLIKKEQDFNYSDFDKLSSLNENYSNTVKLLNQRIRELPSDQIISGFPSRQHALIFIAVQNNDLKELKELAEDIETVDFEISKRSLFSYAVTNSTIPIIKFLLAKGANADWTNTNSNDSILFNVLERGDLEVLQTVMPYIQNMNINNKEGHNPIYFCVQAFYKLGAVEKNELSRNFYYTALQLLRASDADFNQASGRYELPVHLLPDNLVDSLGRSVAVIVLEQTSNQFELNVYAGRFIYQSASDMPIFALLCKILKDTGSLLNNSSLEDAGLFTTVLKEAVNLPTQKSLSYKLRVACAQMNVQKVRWLLNEVPLEYMKRNHSVQADSLRKVIVNTPVAGYNENILYFFLNREHELNWSSKSIIKALMLAGSDLYQMQTLDRKRPIDLLMASVNYQKYYANEILTGFVSRIALECGEPKAWSKVASTGDLFRNSLLSYQEDRKWIKDLKICIKMDLTGPSLTAPPNRHVNITGVGLVSLGKFPVESCSDVDIYKIAGKSPQYVYRFESSTDASAGNIFSKTPERKDAQAFRSDIQVRGYTGIEKMNMSINSNLSIPASVLTENEHMIPPMVIIQNYGDNIVVLQNNISTIVNKNAEMVCDRSRGPIRIECNSNGEKSDIRFDLFGQIQDTEFPDLIVPNENDVLSRLRLYGEIARLQDQINLNAGKTETEKIYRKQDVVIVHLLSEYALQRGFPKKVKEEYYQNQTQLTDINKLMDPLGQFYELHSVLDFSNLPQLKETLQSLIDGPVLSEQQRKNYSALLKQLEQSTKLSQLGETYGQLMNSELLQQAERQLDDKKRLNLEIALFTVGGYLKLEDK